MAVAEKNEEIPKRILIANNLILQPPISDSRYCPQVVDTLLEWERLLSAPPDNPLYLITNSKEYGVDTAEVIDFFPVCPEVGG